MKRAAVCGAVVAVVMFACPFDISLREYLSRRFWLPFAKHGANFEKKGVVRTKVPYAGIGADKATGPLAELRRRYAEISEPQPSAVGNDQIGAALAAARADHSLTRLQREEVELVDAKAAMRLAQLDKDGTLLASARKKFDQFLLTARNPAYRSEARGWLARVLYLQGDQTAAGKIYLDELNRNGSNLSRESLLVSLKIVYGYDGGPKLREHIGEYFDTPEHAAFAIELLTNPKWRDRELSVLQWKGIVVREHPQATYVKIRGLLEKHAELLRLNPEENGLPMLAMRTALRMGDLASAMRIADAVPATAALRSQPDFLWSLGAVRFLSHDFAGAEAPLVALFGQKAAGEGKRAAATYALCGVYQKLGRPVDQLRYALLLRELGRDQYSGAVGSADLSIYYAVSGWDLNLLLEFEAPIEALRTFVDGHPKMAAIDVVRYALAVRLARENRFEEAAALYTALGASGRVVRMRRMAELSRAVEAKPDDYEARYRLADYMSSNSEGLYFNDRIWDRYQRYVFQSSTDVRLNRLERERFVAAERKLKDDQEERWRAYLILRDVVRDAGQSPVGRKSAVLAVNCLRKLSDRFGRVEEIRRADAELSQWLRR